MKTEQKHTTNKNQAVIEKNPHGIIVRVYFIFLLLLKMLSRSGEVYK